MSMGPSNQPPYGRSFPGRPNEPFFFGRGGKRRTPEDIALERRLAAQQMQQGADYSPVASPWQGLARVANGLAGGLRMRSADKMADERAVGQQQSIEALLAPYDAASGASDPVAAALADPELRQLGMSVLESRTPKPVQPTEFARLQTERDALPIGDPRRVEFDRYIAGKSDPIITVTLPGGGIFNGPQSELANVLQGAASVGSAPDTLPPDFDFGEGDRMPVQASAVEQQFIQIYGPEEGRRRYGALVAMSPPGAR